MDYSYIAGFFDGEGSAMALTIKRNIEGRTMYRIRPVIKIAQGTIEVLEVIRDTLGYGTIVNSSDRCYNLQINGNKNIIKFADTVGKYSFLKQRQLMILKELAQYQDENFSNKPYTYESMEHMIDLRDKVFEANTWTRSRIKQKYSKEQILEEHEFINIDEWKNKRQQQGIKALNNYAKSIKKSRELIPCACGCGQLIEQNDSKGRPRKYVRGHNPRKKESSGELMGQDFVQEFPWDKEE